MSKKMMVLAISAFSAAMLILPAAASAWSVDNPGGATFSGTTTTTSRLFASGEPTITCEGPNHISGSIAGTTGTLKVVFTKCHIVVLGITIACKTTNATESNEIITSGALATVGIGGGTTRGIKVTPESTVVRCGSTKPITVAGSVIGELSSPSTCPTATTSATIKFVVEGGKQKFKTETGSSTEINLTATTEGGSPVEGAEEAEGTVTFTESVTVTC